MKKILCLTIIAIATFFVASVNVCKADSNPLQSVSFIKTQKLLPDCDEFMEQYKSSEYYTQQIIEDFYAAMCDVGVYCYENADTGFEKFFWSKFSDEECFDKSEINNYENAKENIYNYIKDVNTDSINSNILFPCDNLMESATSSRITDDDFDTLCDTADDCIDTADSRKEVKFWHDIKSQCFYKEMQKVKSEDS